MTARANIAIHFGELRYFCCPKENIHFGNICYVAVDSAIHNPLGKPRGFLNRSITAPLPKKVTDALPEKKHSLVPPSFFSPSHTCKLFAGMRFRRVLLKASSSNLAGYSTLRWTSRQLSRPILREGIFLLVHFSPLFHKRDCSRRLRACKHTLLTPIRFLWYAPSARFIAGGESKFGRVFYAAKVRLLRLCLCKQGHLGSAAQPFFAGALSFTVCLYLLRLFSLLPAAF